MLGISEVGTGRMGLSSPHSFSFLNHASEENGRSHVRIAGSALEKILLSKAISEEVESEEIERMLKRSEVK